MRAASAREKSHLIAVCHRMTFRVKLSVMTTLLNPVRKYPILDDIVLLLARIALGIILIAHGLQTFNEWALAGTAAAFVVMGVPAPGLTSAIAASADVLGDVLVLMLRLTPLVAVLDILFRRS